MTVDERIGRNVHSLLWDRHLKNRALYEALGVTRFTLQKKMRGQIAWSAEDVATAAEVLGVEPGSLYVTRQYGRRPRLRLILGGAA